MIDHIGLAVSDLARSRAFYDAALRPLGIELLTKAGPEVTESGGTVLGYGIRGHPFFWIGDNEAVGQGTHVAFAVESRSKVNAFFAAAVKAGGTANGEPGPRSGLFGAGLSYAPR